MEDFIIIAILLIIIGGAAWYIVKAKRNGKACIGCPDSGSCGKATGCGCGCSGCTNGCQPEE